MLRGSDLSPTILFPLVGAGVLLTGCGASAPSADDVVVRDSAGIEIVESHGAGWADGAGWRVGDEPTLRIGALSSPEPAYEFTVVRGAVRLADGRIVALDYQTNELRWFDADGRHLLTAGGRGEGPGELNVAFGLHRLAGDTLMVEDRPRTKRVLYSPEGEYIREAALDYDRYAERGPWAECPSQVLPDGSLLLCRPDPDEPDLGPDPGPGHLRRFHRFVRASWDLDTIRPLGRYGGIEQWGIEWGGRTRFAVHPFHSRTQVAAGGSALRVAIATNPEYSVEVWRPDGTLERIVRRPGARLAPSAAQREAADEMLGRYAMDDEALANRFRAEVVPPDSLPAVHGLSIDAVDHLWVRRAPALLPGSVAEFDIFDPTGEFLGTLELPVRFRPTEIGADYILGVARDQNDVEYVELYSLERG